MIKILKYSSLIITFFFISCLFNDPINLEVVSNFTYSGTLTVSKPIALVYIPPRQNKSTLVLKWSIESVPKYSLLEKDSFLPSNDINKRVFIPDTPGNYTISLVVEDEYHAKSITRKIISIRNNLPNAVINSLNDGTDFLVNRKLFFDSSNSYDLDNILISFKWSIITVPKGSNLININSKNEKFDFTPDVEGSYTIKLIVTDVNLESNYTTYSFYAKKSSPIKIKEMNPDNSISIIPLKIDGNQLFSILLYNESININELEYHWYISINNDDYILSSNSDELNLFGENYGIGDFLSIKLDIINDFDEVKTIFWRVIVIQ